MNKLLEIKNLGIQFCHHQRIVRAVSGVNLDIYEGEILALVGESGSGKTLTALSVCGLLADAAKVVSGQILFKGRDLLKADDRQLQAVRGQDIAYIFQEAAASLNPVLTVGRQLSEAIMLHQDRDRKDARVEALRLLKMAHLNHPADVLKSYPHQLSGGMNQRVMIAMALSSWPKLLIADEPTTALDVTVEAQIIRMLLELSRELKFSILFITHNLELAQRFAGRIAIMYQGRIVDEGLPDEIFSGARHPHTRELAQAVLK